MPQILDALDVSARSVPRLVRDVHPNARRPGDCCGRYGRHVPPDVAALSLHDYRCVATAPRPSSSNASLGISCAESPQISAAAKRGASWSANPYAVGSVGNLAWHAGFTQGRALRLKLAICKEPT